MSGLEFLLYGVSIFALVYVFFFLREMLKGDDEVKE